MNLPAEIALVVLAGLAVAACVALLPNPRAAPGRARVTPAPARPAQLVELERLVITSGTSAVHVHAYLRPLLAEIASRRLATRGQALERMPDAIGRELLRKASMEVSTSASVANGQTRRNVRIEPNR